MTLTSNSTCRNATPRSKCLFFLSLLYRLKWIRYLLLTTILLLVLFGVSITELRQNRYITYIQQHHGNSKLNRLIYREEKDTVNTGYRVNLRDGNDEERILRDEGRNVDNVREIINVKAFADGAAPGFSGGDVKESSTEDATNSISFNLKYINNKMFSGESKADAIKAINEYISQGHKTFNDVRALLENHINENIRSSGQPNSVFLTTDVILNEALKKGVNVSRLLEYVINQRKLKTIDTPTTTKKTVSSPVPPINKLEQTQSRTNELFSSSTTNTEKTVPNTQSTSTSFDKPQQKCKPYKNVIFLKTHKTGSSTIINIMQRYGHTHELKVALPNVTHFLGWPNTFQQKYVFEHLPGMKYNILCNHARFQRERMLKLMASEDTKIVTIIRDPLYQFESTAVYLNFYALFGINRKLNLLDAFFNKSKMEIYNRTKKRNTHNIFLVKNPITYDMGYPTWREDKTLIDKILAKVKRDFHLVMISDYMAESLIMLKEELCWDLKDIVYFTMNKRPDKLRQKIKDRTKTRQKVKNWNRIDNAIFEHYNQTFWDRVQKGGTRFQEEVKKLKDTNEWLREMCLAPGRHFDKSQPWFPILGFKLKNDTQNFKYRTLCENMIRSEIDYTNLLKLKQTRLNWTIPKPPPKKRRKKMANRQSKKLTKIPNTG